MWFSIPDRMFKQHTHHFYLLLLFAVLNKVLKVPNIVQIVRSLRLLNIFKKVLKLQFLSRLSKSSTVDGRFSVCAFSSNTCRLWEWDESIAMNCDVFHNSCDGWKLRLQPSQPLDKIDGAVTHWSGNVLQTENVRFSSKKVSYEATLLTCCNLCVRVGKSSHGSRGNMPKRGSCGPQKMMVGAPMWRCTGAAPCNSCRIDSRSFPRLISDWISYFIMSSIQLSLFKISIRYVIPVQWPDSTWFSEITLSSYPR